MKNISIIACVGKNNELGKNNDLIWHLPNDLKFFRQMTLGKTVIMGKRTFQSLSHALPKRRNIVIQHKKEQLENVEVFNDIESVLENVQNEDVFVIGGASIYQEFLPYADKIYLTEVDSICGDADVYFPLVDKEKYIKTIIGENEDNGIKYNFVLYEKK